MSTDRNAQGTEISRLGSSTNFRRTWKVQPRQATEISERERTFLRRLKEAEIYQSYQHSFCDATGFPLRLVGPWQVRLLGGDRDCQRPAVRVAPDGEGNRMPRGHRVRLKGDSSAGREHIAVPVFLGVEVVAYLVTGRDSSQGEGAAADNNSDAMCFEAAVTLLTCFSAQLSRFAEELDLMDTGDEPLGILRARKFIRSRLGEPLPLAVLARHAGLSESHFCRLFKEHTGLTMTDYVTRYRVLWAKRKLLRSSLRIAEVADMVGFHSLSQFNRSFVRFVGCSPSAYREARLRDCKR